jgi:hypothetical protein
MPYARYLTVVDVRAEGPPFNDATTYPDAWVEDKIDLASEQIENFTGNFFTPLTRTGVSAIRLDGNGANFLRVPFPIIQVDTVTLIYAARYGADPTYSVDTDELVIYNRHLTQGLQQPDDRKLPGIAIEAFLAYPKEDLNIWPTGEQNIKIEGVFGWTTLAASDTVGETVAGSQIPQSQGATPHTIKRACMLLVRRAWPQLGDFQSVISTTKSLASLTQMKVRDQSVSWAADKGSSSSMIGGTTGDADVDRMLFGFRQTAKMGWA